MSFSYQYTPYVWPVLTGIGLGTGLGIYSWRHRNVPGARGLAFLSLFTVILLTASALDLAAGDVATKIFWFQIREFCLLPITVAGLAFAMEYAGLDAWVNLRTMTLLVLPTFFFIPLAFTNDAHHLIWTHLWMDGNIRSLAGVFNYGMMAYGVLLSALTLSILVWVFIRSPLQRWPVGLIFVNMLAGRTFYFLDAAGLNPVKPLHPIDVACNFIFLIYFLALFHFRLFDVVPVARGRALEQMRDGMLVLDAQDRVAEVNGTAQSLLDVSRSKALGRKITQVMRAYPRFVELAVGSVSTQKEVWLDEARCLRIHVSPLANQRGFALGKLILFYDISEEKRAQKELQDHQRRLAGLEEREWLARELHDGVGQALAAAHLQVSSAGELLTRGQAAGVKICLDQLAAVIKEGKALVGDYLFGVKAWSPTDGFFAGLRRYLTNYRRNGGVPTDLVLPPEIESHPFGPTIETQLQRIIQEALTNIKKHANARAARVIFSPDGGELEIRIEDDGRGFDPALLGDHSGFGLRAMAGRGQAAGGRVEIRSAPGRGTQVLVRVPWRKERHEDVAGR